MSSGRRQINATIGVVAALLLWGVALAGAPSLASSRIVTEPGLSPVDAPPPEVAAECERIAGRLASVSLDMCLGARLRPTGVRTVEGTPLLVSEFPPLEDRVPLGRVLLLGGTHGDELSSVSVVFRWLEILSENHSGMFHWRVAPLVNPDGLFWRDPKRTNANGVDLNRNFPSEAWWESTRRDWIGRTGKNPRRYPGQGPASEAETRWVVDEVERFRPDVIVSVHAPYSILDFDGPPKAPQRLGPLRLNPLGTYPGSLGRWAGVGLGLPVVTVELPHAGIMPSAADQLDMWRDLVRWLRGKLEPPPGRSSSLSE